MIGKWVTRIIIITFILLPSCVQQPAPILSVGTNVWPGYEPLYLARETSLLDNHLINLVEYSSNSQVIQSFRNGLIDAAALTLDEAMLLMETGEKIKIKLVLDVSNGGDVLIADRSIKQLSEIKGKKIGVEGTALGAYFITRCLEIAGVNKEDIELHHLTIDEHKEAFQQGRVDALVTFEPVRSQLIKNGAHVLFDSSQISGEIVDVLVIRESYLNEYPEVVKHLEESWFRALKKMEDEPKASAAIIGHRMKLSINETLKVYQGLILPDRKRNEVLLKGEPEPALLKTARRLSALMVENGLLESPVNVESMF